VGGKGEAGDGNHGGPGAAAKPIGGGETEPAPYQGQDGNKTKKPPGLVGGFS